MSSKTSGGSRLPRAAALLALLVIVLIATPGARAGCVHNGLLRNDAAGAASRFEWLGRAGALATLPDEPTDEHPGRPIPCSGALCSGKPAIPLLPAPSNPGHRGEWAALESPAPPSGADSTSVERDAPGARPIHAGLAIFHPPRPILHHLAP